MLIAPHISVHTAVALHPEGVDRNSSSSFRSTRISRVALHPEGVDRNIQDNTVFKGKERSPSTRRAWIEMTNRCH